jgi:Ca-activated chloride channel homolog
MTGLSGFRFQEPLFLLLALTGPLVLLLAWLRERHGRAVAFPGLARIARLRPGWRVRARHLPAALAALGLIAAAVALARPQHGSLRENVTTQGVDIVVALDVSGSMAAEDFQPRNRLEVAKQVVADFVARRKTDRIGLVVFAGRSLTKAPPTTDAALLLRQLDDVKLDMLPDGTAVGLGLTTALSRLRHSQAKSKVIVLVTDGANNAGEIDPPPPPTSRRRCRCASTPSASGAAAGCRSRSRCASRSPARWCAVPCRWRSTSTSSC